MESQLPDRYALREPNPPVPLLSGPAAVWRSVVHHHSLVANLIRRDLRLKYRNSSLGYFWSLVEPLLLSGVYYILFILIAGNPEPRYHLFVVIGVITWGFFSRGLNGAVTSLTGNEAMIKQVYFPREIFAITTVGSQLVMGVLSLLITIPFMVFYRIAPTPLILMVPAGLILLALLAVGVGLTFACLNVINRDVQHMFRFLVRAGLFLSPVLWTVERATGARHDALGYLLLNPVAVPITMVRNGITGMPLAVDGAYIWYAVGVCVLSFFVGASVFRRYEAEVVKKL